MFSKKIAFFLLGVLLVTAVLLFASFTKASAGEKNFKPRAAVLVEQLKEFHRNTLPGYEWQRLSSRVYNKKGFCWVSYLAVTELDSEREVLIRVNLKKEGKVWRVVKWSF